MSEVSGFTFLFLDAIDYSLPEDVWKHLYWSFISKMILISEQMQFKSRSPKMTMMATISMP